VPASHLLMLSVSSLLSTSSAVWPKRRQREISEKNSETPQLFTYLYKKEASYICGLLIYTDGTVVWRSCDSANSKRCGNLQIYT
jgi:hypothetical protein